MESLKWGEFWYIYYIRFLYMFAFFIEIEKYYMCYLSYVEDFQKILS